MGQRLALKIGGGGEEGVRLGWDSAEVASIIVSSK